ncbi:hypothetical protein HPP92_008849 [Vanilla planifolia]|uniref:Uncharacterized protein n=1 Tax=Vanilla planifolia TaxID=51239 RepID=A0A835R965_VANPL|nr:hypothetical protein HPP92_008849 [Vanilla planifolia]
MASFNVIQKVRRARIQERKRVLQGDPVTRKLKKKTDNIPISGKRKRKLFKKWRREKKGALQKGLITMEDVEMADADGTSQNDKESTKMKFRSKKALKLKIKRLKRKGRSKKKSHGQPNGAPNDAMVE